jgi:uncharacterized delta-60 repeat protein
VAARFDERTNVWPLLAMTTDASSRVLVGLPNRVTRLTMGGELDTSFGEGGHFESNLGEYRAHFQSPGILPDGRILAAGRRDIDGESEGQLFVVRLTEDGALDPTFGGGGVVLDDQRSRSSSIGVGQITAQEDGTILIAATRPGTSGVQLMLGRLSADGVPDPSFGTDGWATASDEPVPAPRMLPSMDRQSDGALLAFGRMLGPDLDADFARFSTTGTLDGSFGDGGAGQVSAFVPHLLHGAVLGDDRILTIGPNVRGATAVLGRACSCSALNPDADSKWVCPRRPPPVDGRPAAAAATSCAAGGGSGAPSSLGTSHSVLLTRYCSPGSFPMDARRARAL